MARGGVHSNVPADPLRGPAERHKVRWAMRQPPDKLDGAQLLRWTVIDSRHRPTGKCRHEVAGQRVGVAAGLAICKYDGGDAYYLFGCDAAWAVVTDTCHETLDEALAQAELEYQGVSETWSAL